MEELILAKGNEALGEAAIRAGCRHFFGYPITPQSELPAYMARRMPQVGGTYLQAESELAAINMCLGAASVGRRVLTSSSSPGFSLKQEGISYISCSEVPVVVVNIQRAGPGLANIQPGQSDYFQAVKGGGHGDYRMLVLAPASIQELVDLTGLAFELADKYRMVVAILGDGLMGQTMEPVRYPTMTDPTVLPAKQWAVSGAAGRAKKTIMNAAIGSEDMEAVNQRLQAKYAEVKRSEVRREEYQCDDAEIVLVAYGSSARVSMAAVEQAREQGIKAGLFRPISLWPFPTEQLRALAGRGVKRFLAVEMSAGQMVEDVELAVRGQAPVDLYGRTGGMVPMPDEVLAEIQRLAGGEA